MLEFSSGLIVFLTLLAIVVGLLWLVLPFAIFGIKSRLDHTNRLLTEVRDALKRPGMSEPSVQELIALRRAKMGEGAPEEN